MPRESFHHSLSAWRSQTLWRTHRTFECNLPGSFHCSVSAVDSPQDGHRLLPAPESSGLRSPRPESSPGDFRIQSARSFPANVKSSAKVIAVRLVLCLGTHSKAMVYCYRLICTWSGPLVQVQTATASCTNEPQYKNLLQRDPKGASTKLGYKRTSA